MSKLVPRRCLFRGLFKSLFDFRRDFDQTFYRKLINWPFSEAPPLREPLRDSLLASDRPPGAPLTPPGGRLTMARGVQESAICPAFWVPRCGLP